MTDLMIDPHTFDAWLIGARSEEVRASKMTSRTIMGQTLIFFRDEAGRAVALDSRCPHKGVSLVQGRLRKGEVQCAYHGWRFDSAGKCTHVPSALPGEELPCARLQRFPVVEQDGWVWIFWGDAPEEARGRPPRFPLHEEY
ncbi:MAG TPA: Rieske 2Fe-2S domain-containing protein, partial [Labilithrix sp.]|nr:Rieske 2Fe-2S domain-containing protein [Labilithrix sp.]